ncbi:hypothetical protein WN943_011741 [Citrus x changshan-huyou]
MGNYVSCTLPTPLMKSPKAARVILPGGEIRQFRELVKAAEVMLECPNFFLTNAKSLHIGKRFSALAADEELEFGNVYIMFPMKRVNSMVTAADMASLFMAAHSAAKRISGGQIVRVSPESGAAAAAAAASCAEKEERLNDGGKVDDDDNNNEEASRLSLEGDHEGYFPVPEFKYRLVSCRSRKPLLETIKEEPVCSR